MNLSDAMEFLLSNQYVLSSGKGKYVFSKKFEEEYKVTKQVQKLPVLVVNPQIALPVKALPKGVNDVYYAERFMKFIIAAGVPNRIPGTRGSQYPGNKYNEKAAIAFHNMIVLEGVNYELLVNSTKLYYSSGVDFKKTIGNYILDGCWRTDYEELKERASKGETELKEHIKKELSNGEHTPFRLG